MLWLLLSNVTSILFLLLIISVALHISANHKVFPPVAVISFLFLKPKQHFMFIFCLLLKNSCCCLCATHSSIYNFHLIDQNLGLTLKREIGNNYKTEYLLVLLNMILNSPCFTKWEWLRQSFVQEESIHPWELR